MTLAKLRGIGMTVMVCALSFACGTSRPPLVYSLELSEFAHFAAMRRSYKCTYVGFIGTSAKAERDKLGSALASRCRVENDDNDSHSSGLVIIEKRKEWVDSEASIILAGTRWTSAVGLSDNYEDDQPGVKRE
jgi:hypothetical protein